MFAGTFAAAASRGAKLRAFPMPRGLRLFSSDQKEVETRQPIASNPPPHFTLKHIRYIEEQCNSEGPYFANQSRQHNMQSPQRRDFNQRSDQDRLRRWTEPVRSKPHETQSRWIEIHGTPPMANLDDIVRSVNRVMDEEHDLGIVDLDGALQMDGTLPMVKNDKEPWVQSAKFVLSAHARPTSWRIEFRNRSIAHAFLQRAETIPFLLVWKPVPVNEWNMSAPLVPAPLIMVDDTMIRVENFASDMTIDFVRHLFRRYDLAQNGPTVVPWECEATSFKLFVVRFKDPSWARAAVRELQGVEVDNRQLRLAQYPKQITRDEVALDEHVAVKY